MHLERDEQLQGQKHSCKPNNTMLHFGFYTKQDEPSSNTQNSVLCKNKDVCSSLQELSLCLPKISQGILKQYVINETKAVLTHFNHNLWNTLTFNC